MSAKGLDSSSFQGSVKELWLISCPLIISLMSSSLMLFLDRLFLAHYSLEALNASARAGAAVQFLQFWSIATAAIAEVFVGRYNGAGRFRKLGQPVWQMIWLSLGTTLIYMPIGYWGGSFLFSDLAAGGAEGTYFCRLTCFIPLAALSAALCSFYIGKGKVRLVTIVMLGANGLNAALDALLIFGWGSWIPEMGLLGAAWATGLSLSVQAAVLFIAFFSPSNRQTYGTGRWQLHWPLFWRCLGMGLPNAVAHSVEIFAWVGIFELMTRLGPDHLTVVTIAQSILFLFSFMTEGISKGATAIASNLMGSQRHEEVWKLFMSGIQLYIGLFLIIGLFLVAQPTLLIGWFLPDADLQTSWLNEGVQIACFWVWLYFLFDGINWLLIGLLTAAGDTPFVMKVGGTTPILFALLPVYLLVFLGGAPPHVTWFAIACYALLSGCIYWQRFKNEKWKELIVGE